VIIKQIISLRVTLRYVTIIMLCIRTTSYTIVSYKPKPMYTVKVHHTAYSV